MNLKSIHIPLDVAEKEISDYIAIRKSIDGLIKSFPEDAKKYYKDHISFIFERSEIIKLFELNPDANALRAYYGFNSDGLATIVLVACEATHDAAGVVNHASNLINSLDLAAVEWPTGKPPTLSNHPFKLLNDYF